MQLHSIDTGYFKLDGGAMFGVVPKSLWTKFNPADNNNMCTWAMRCLLIEEGDRLILVDTGIGDKQSEKFFSYFYLHGENSLTSSLQDKGYSLDDVTDVILTHLHFDHCGGSIYRDKDGSLKPTFRNAKYWSHSRHWDWAMTPNNREKASFLKENFEPLLSTDQISFIDKENIGLEFLDFIIAEGHTEAQLIPKISYKDKTLVYCADLMPSPYHIPLPYVMAYDIRPLVTLDEREVFLNNAFENNWTLMYEHDPKIECSTLIKTERGIRMGDVFSLSEF